MNTADKTLGQRPEWQRPRGTVARWRYRFVASRSVETAIDLPPVFAQRGDEIFSDY